MKNKKKKNNPTKGKEKLLRRDHIGKTRYQRLSRVRGVISGRALSSGDHRVRDSRLPRSRSTARPKHVQLSSDRAACQWVKISFDLRFENNFRFFLFSLFVRSKKKNDLMSSRNDGRCWCRTAVWHEVRHNNIAFFDVRVRFPIFFFFLFHFYRFSSHLRIILRVFFFPNCVTSLKYLAYRGGCSDELEV